MERSSKETKGARARVTKAPEEKVAGEKKTSNLFGANVDFAEATSKVVEQAASILETEVAAGIAVAKKLEDQVIDTEKLRSEKPEEVMARFRRDAHEVVDILADIAAVSMKYMLDVSRNAITIRGRDTTSKAEQASGEQLPVIKVAEAVKPGETGKVSMTLQNDGDTETEEFRFTSTDLVSGAGERIPSKHVTFAPQALRIEQHKAARVDIAVDVPKGTPAGTYSGLVLATSTYQLRSELVVKVE
jgi:hypothetical protein